MSSKNLNNGLASARLAKSTTAPSAITIGVNLRLIRITPRRLHKVKCAYPMQLGSQRRREMQRSCLSSRQPSHIGTLGTQAIPISFLQPKIAAFITTASSWEGREGADRRGIGAAS